MGGYILSRGSAVHINGKSCLLDFLVIVLSFLFFSNLNLYDAYLPNYTSWNYDKQVDGQIGAEDNNRDELMLYINSNTIINKSSVNTKHTAICFNQSRKFLHCQFCLSALYVFFCPNFKTWGKTSVSYDNFPLLFYLVS